MELNERKKRILKSIIDEYIDRGEPVGSKHLMQSGNISLSPATIRNEMSDLEEMGYLDKPHASAGRVPSPNAYRLYAESLMEEYQATAEQLGVLSELTRFKAGEMDAIVEKARKVMSKLTGYATITLTQESDESTVEHFETLLIDPKNLLIVPVLPDGTAVPKQLRTDEPLTEADAVTFKAALNLHLAGKSAANVALPDMMALEEAFGEHKALVSPILRLVYEAVGENGSLQVEGLSNLLSLPEFNNVEKVKNLLDLFEHDGENIKSCLPVAADGDKRALKVYVGGADGENGKLSDASLVFCSLPVGKKNTVFGILGPRRMDYKKAAYALTQLSETIKRMQADGADNTQ